ncbi:hypothetical protein JL720_16594 [Aureococcus anophagefferens]|nr:hypothetical protein JL720_16594 [Aureococcus anophagefferens]
MIYCYLIVIFGARGGASDISPREQSLAARRNRSECRGSRRSRAQVKSKSKKKKTKDAKGGDKAKAQAGGAGREEKKSKGKGGKR